MANRRYHRLACRVREHAPTEEDVRAFLTEFKAQRDKRHLKVRGVTTDASSLYPKVLKELWPGVPQQVCRFPILKESTKAVLKVLAKLRKEMKEKLPQFHRGPPTKEQHKLARRCQRRQQRVAAWFKHRHLFGKRPRSRAEKQVLKRLGRGQPPLRAVREIRDEV